MRMLSRILTVLMVEVVAEAAVYRPDITLHLEYKPFETRVHKMMEPYIFPLLRSAK